ncbi:MAG: permease [Chloroflexota bacterium]
MDTTQTKPVRILVQPLTIAVFIPAVLLATYALFTAILSTDSSAASVLSIFSTRFLGIFIEAAPFLLLGSVASGLIEVFISANDITRWIPRRKLPATLVGTFLGFTFPVCECGIVPVVRRLYGKGLPMGVGVAFLLAAPVMNPIVFAATYIAFGWGPVLIGRFVITAVVALAVGLIFSYSAKPIEILQPQSFAPVRGGSEDVIGQPADLWDRFTEAMGVASNEFFEMGRYLVIGSMLAAGMQTTLSQDVLVSLGQGPVQSVLVMQALAFVLSVCSTVDAFLALAFAGTFTTGSILAFLTFGPMVDIKSMLMFTGVFRQRVVVYLVVLPLLMTALISIWLNLNVAF